jgi:hypothetical protein
MGGRNWVQNIYKYYKLVDDLPAGPPHSAILHGDGLLRTAGPSCARILNPQENRHP